MYFAGAKGEAARYGSKLVACADTGCGEAGFEDATDRGNEAGSSGQKDAVYIPGGDAGCFQQAVYAVLDGLKVFADPRFEAGAGDVGLNIHAAIAELELGCVTAGEIDLQTLNGLMKLIAEVLVDECDECFDLFRFECVGTSAFENLMDVPSL